METCEITCNEMLSQNVKINFIDKLIGRSWSEKASNICHIHCVKEHKLGNIKKNGRWGFVPLLGMTEAFSSLFALLSFFIIVYKFKTRISHKLHRTPMRKLYQIQYYAGIAAFISSFMFHFRETPFTRNADYFSAFASILIGLIVVLNRLVLLKNRQKLAKFHKYTLRIGLAYFVLHIYKMAWFEFDYFYNKIVCAAMFFVSCVCNFILFLNYRGYPHSREIIYSIGCLLAAGGVEILDISPIFYLFDSHAVWHLLMTCSTPLYFNFVGNDIDFHIHIKKETPDAIKKQVIHKYKRKQSLNKCEQSVNIPEF